jgi:hypothetical protein
MKLSSGRIFSYYDMMTVLKSAFFEDIELSGPANTSYDLMTARRVVIDDRKDRRGLREENER